MVLPMTVLDNLFFQVLLNHGMCLVSIVLGDDSQLLAPPNITLQVGREVLDG